MTLLKRLIISITALSALSLAGNMRATTPEGILVQDGQKVAFMGDSITNQGWERAGGYVQLVVSGLKTIGVNIVPIPAGIGGNTSKDMLARLDRDVLSKKPDWLTLSCGVNDVWHGLSGVELEPYKQNITAIVDQAQKAGIKVMILTATVIQEQDNDFNQKLVAYNDFLRDLAKQRGLPLADLNASFQSAIKAAALPPGKKLLTEDGVHPTPDGHQLMASGVLSAFGASAAQVTKIQDAWLDSPASALVSAISSFRVGDPITLRQYNTLKKRADVQNTTVANLCSTVFFDAIVESVKAHSQEPAMNQSVIEAEAQKGFNQKIEALAKP